MTEFEHLLTKTLQAAQYGTAQLTETECMASALVLNRTDWLEKWHRTIPEAMMIIGFEWATYITRAAEILMQVDTDAPNAKEQTLSLAKTYDFSEWAWPQMV